MTLQSYLADIKAKTGKTPEDFKKLAFKRGLLNDAATANQIIEWLKTEFNLGRLQAMAIYETLKEKNSNETKKTSGPKRKKFK